MSNHNFIDVYKVMSGQQIILFYVLDLIYYNKLKIDTKKILKILSHLDQKYTKLDFHNITN